MLRDGRDIGEAQQLIANVRDRLAAHIEQQRAEIRARIKTGYATARRIHAYTEAIALLRT